MLNKPEKDFNYKYNFKAFKYKHHMQHDVNTWHKMWFCILKYLCLIPLKCQSSINMQLVRLWEASIGLLAANVERRRGWCLSKKSIYPISFPWLARPQQAAVSALSLKWKCMGIIRKEKKRHPASHAMTLSPFFTLPKITPPPPSSPPHHQELTDKELKKNPRMCSV